MTKARATRFATPQGSDRFSRPLPGARCRPLRHPHAAAAECSCARRPPRPRAHHPWRRSRLSRAHDHLDADPVAPFERAATMSPLPPTGSRRRCVSRPSRRRMATAPRGRGVHETPRPPRAELSARARATFSAVDQRLRARLSLGRQRQSGEASLLLNHMDVVPGEVPFAPRQWTHAPFAAPSRMVLSGDAARGTTNPVFSVLEAAELLIAAGHAPTRTMYFAFGCDEEVLGRRGAVRSRGFREARHSLRLGARRRFCRHARWCPA